MNNRAKIGIKGIPSKRGFDAVQYYFQFDLEKKDLMKVIKEHIKNNYSKEDAGAINSNSEWRFTIYPGIVAASYCIDNGIKFPEKYERYPEVIKKYFEDLIESGKEILKSKVILEQEKETRKIVSPQQRLMNKIHATVMLDVDEMEDGWYEGEKPDFDIVAAFRIYELKGMAVSPVVEYLQRLLPEYEDAHSGNCKDAKKAYEHLSKRELSRRIKVITNMITNLQKYKIAQKAMRKKRKIK
tara:strand:- start:1503 stop:2225 length:723 start_codon:yes stop_codon:yes gene_type:complete